MPVMLFFILVFSSSLGYSKDYFQYEFNYKEEHKINSYAFRKV